jgi:hypothetical protein
VADELHLCVTRGGGQHAVRSWPWLPARGNASRACGRSRAVDDLLHQFPSCGRSSAAGRLQSPSKSSTSYRATCRRTESWDGGTASGSAPSSSPRVAGHQRRGPPPSPYRSLDRERRCLLAWQAARTEALRACAARCGTEEMHQGLAVLRAPTEVMPATMWSVVWGRTRERVR